MTLRWLDLFIGDDPHPRRFDGPRTLAEYLRRVERLPEEAVQALVTQGEVGPPVARRPYRVVTVRTAVVTE